MTEPVSLAISPCPNDTFVFHALLHGRVPLPGLPPVTVRFADIDVCNDVAARGEADIVKVSYAALPWLLRDYRLLPTGGAVGHGCGPLVLAREAVPPAAIAGATVAVPGLRTTAALLFRLWSQGFPPGRVEVMPFEQIMPAVREGRVDAGLLIHEARFVYPAYGLREVADLGAWWESATGLPVPLGAIVARRGLDHELWTAAVRASVRAAWRDPSASSRFVALHAQETAPEVVAQHIAHYVNEFTDALGDAGFAAAQTLLDRAAAAGLVPPVTDLRD